MEKELPKTLGAAARQARKALDLTQEDVADRIGVSAEFYARIERGHSLPSVPTFARIAGALGVSADTLIGRHLPAVAHRPSWLPPQAPDSPEIRRIVRRLRRASPAALRLVSLLMKEMERSDAERGDATVPAVPPPSESSPDDADE